MATDGLTHTIYANNLATQRFIIYDEAGSPARKNLTGLTIKWALSALIPSGTPPYSTEVIFEKVSTDALEIDVTDAAQGELDVFILPANTLTLSGTYHFELEAVDGSSNGVVLATGTLTINRNVVNT